MGASISLIISVRDMWYDGCEEGSFEAAHMVDYIRCHMNAFETINLIWQYPNRSKLIASTDPCRCHFCRKPINYSTLSCNELIAKSTKQQTQHSDTYRVLDV